MADLTKEQLRQQNDILFANNNSGNITAEDLRTFNDEMIDAVALDNNPSFTGSVLVQGDVSASTYYGDGSNLTGVTSEVPSGTVSGSSQIDYPLISNIPSGIISSSSQVDLSLATGVATSALTASRLEGNAEQVSHVDFLVGGDTAIEQRMSWNDTDGTLNLGLKGGNVTLQVGQELVTRAVNKSGVDLLEANYQVVQILGAQGNRLSVELASADGVDAQSTLGVVTETILINQEGFVTTNGIVRGIDTRGPGVEDWQDGDPLYLSDTTPGGLTNIKPSAPSQLVKVGFVITSAPNGSLYVKVEVGTALTELYDVTITSASNGDVLKYNSGLDLWENVPSADITGSFATLGSNTFIGNQVITGSLGVADNSLIISSGSNTISFDPYIVSGDAAQVIFTAPNANFNSTGNFNIQVGGIAAIDATTRIDLNSTVNSNGNHIIAGTNTAPSQTLSVEDGNGTARLQVNNATLKGLTGVDVVLNGNGLVGGNLTFPAPGQVINIAQGTVEAGEIASPLLLVDTIQANSGTVITLSNNTILSGSLTLEPNKPIEATQVQANESVISPFIESQTGTFTIGSNTTINGSNGAPSQTFSAKDGNGTPRLQVNNATLGGLSGTDVLVNGNLLNDGDTTITNSVIINDGGVNNNYIGIRANGGGGALPNGKNSGDIDIQAGNKLTLSSTLPMNINSAMTMNGAVLMNTALYQNSAQDLYATGNNLTNLADYFEIELTSDTTINISTLIGGTSRRAYLIIQQNASTAYTFSITQDLGSMIVLASPGVFTTNFPTPTGTINIDSTLGSFTFVELIATTRNGNENLLHIRMNDSLTDSPFGAP